MASGRTVQKRRTSRPPARRAQVRPDVDVASDDLDVAGEPALRWPWVSGLILSVLGLIDAAYLAYDHYSGTAPAACAEHGVVNCAKVTTSVYSKIHGVPVVDLGLAFFAVMLVLQLPAMWRSTSRALRTGRVLWSLVGVGTALWLIYAELFKIDNICLYCTAVHVIALLLFATTAFATAATAPMPGDE